MSGSRIIRNPLSVNLSTRILGTSRRTSRRLCESGHAFPDRIVQAPVLFSHDELIAAWDVVDTHGELHHHLVQCKEDVEHLVTVALAGGLVAQFAPFSLVLLCHLAHAVIPLALKYCDSKSNPEMEIETIYRCDKRGLLPIKHTNTTRMSCRCPGRNQHLWCAFPEQTGHAGGLQDWLSMWCTLRVSV